MPPQRPRQLKFRFRSKEPRYRFIINSLKSRQPKQLEFGGDSLPGFFPETTSLNNFYLTQNTPRGATASRGDLLIRYDKDLSGKISEKMLGETKPRRTTFNFEYDPHATEGSATLDVTPLSTSTKATNAPYPRLLREMVTTIADHFPRIRNLEIYRSLPITNSDSLSRQRRVQRSADPHFIQDIESVYDPQAPLWLSAKIGTSKPQLKINLDHWRNKYGRK